jgi:cell division protein FtsB
MKVDWELTGSKDKSVIDNGKKLGHALALLRTDFSKEAERKKKGGELTAKEKAEFDKIKAQQKELLAKIKKLEKEAQKDKALEKGLRKIQA